MKAACITAVVLIAIGIAVWSSWSGGRQNLLPAPAAPDAPQWVQPGKAEPQKPPTPPPQPEPQGPTSAFPPSHDPPAYGLPLAIRTSAPEVPPELAEPSPPLATAKSGGKPSAAKTQPAKKP